MLQTVFLTLCSAESAGETAAKRRAHCSRRHQDSRKFTRPWGWFVKHWTENKMQTLWYQDVGEVTAWETSVLFFHAPEYFLLSRDYGSKTTYVQFKKCFSEVGQVFCFYYFIKAWQKFPSNPAEVVACSTSHTCSWPVFKSIITDKNRCNKFWCS